ncbi:hypothetical protein ACL9RL_04590 [Plantibacter sp. Mn2098]|uniref:hypothetical protein n=1 Tax=Plantibacter sp. Mn2098 TaxID=3395266 RepID=UPI003BBD9030
MSSRPSLSNAPAIARLHANALHNLLDLNSVETADGVPFIRAGGGYEEPWTRDAAINSWNAASLVSPDIARSTLELVCETDTDGEHIVAQDNQWWDQVVWITAAWRHLLRTGDVAFGREARHIGRRTLAHLHTERFDAGTGLYRGPALMQDGISGYPTPPNDPAITSSFVLDYPIAATLFSLSTNLSYVLGLEALANLDEADGVPAPALRERASALRKAIDAAFWSEEDGTYRYVLPGDPTEWPEVGPHIELAGLALVIETGLCSPERAVHLLETTHREPFGHVNVWPHYTDRYSPEHPGRHNAILWPMVMGMWGSSAAEVRHLGAFDQVLTDLQRLVDGSDGDFFEVYNARDGSVDGGWQISEVWSSLPNQTWSATAFLKLVHEGLFGLRFGTGGLRFEPLVPARFDGAGLHNVAYRGATVSVTLQGHGDQIASIRINGRDVDLDAAAHLPASATGPQDVIVTLR